MTTNRVAALQMSSRADVKKNLESAAELIKKAADAGAKLAVLPEMFAIINATDEQKLKAKEKFGSGPIQDFLAEQALKNNIWLVGGTIPIASENCEKYRAACLVHNNQGERVARYDKIHLFDAEVKPGVEVYQESRDTEPGDTITVIETPLGKLGVAICYDIRFPELFRLMQKQGIEIIAIPAAFVVKTGQAHWETLMRARAIENFCYVIGAGQTGIHDNGRSTYGHSMIVHPWGNVMACLPETVGIVTADIKLQELEKIRTDFPTQKHRRLQ